MVERQYSKDTDNVNIAEIILKNEKTRQSSEAVSNIGESRAGIEKIKDSEEADVNYDSKIQPIKSCIDLYRAAYMRGFGRSKIKTSKNLNVPRELLINCILTPIIIFPFVMGISNWRDIKLLLQGEYTHKMKLQLHSDKSSTFLEASGYSVIPI